MEGMCEGNTLYNSPVPSIVDMVSGRSLRLCEHGVYVSFSHKTRTRRPGDVELGKNKPNGLYLTTMDFFLWWGFTLPGLLRRCGLGCAGDGFQPL